MKVSLSLILFVMLFNVQPTRRATADSVCLNAEEMKLYSLIMEYRKSKKLKPIPLSLKLSQVARAHTHDLSENYQFNPDNKCNPHSWSAEGKWTACCYTPDHKQAKCMWDKPMEIAQYSHPGYEIAYYSSAGTNAQEAIDGWKKSPAHNPLLINDGIWAKLEWNAIGISLYKDYGVVWFGDLHDETTPAHCE